jgi:hypothetical protein
VSLAEERLEVLPVGVAPHVVLALG